MAGTLTSISEEDIEDAKHPTPKSPHQTEVPEHLTDLYRRSWERVPTEFHDKIAALLSNYTDVFSSNDADIGRTKCVKQRPQRFPRPNRKRYSDKPRNCCKTAESNHPTALGLRTWS